MTSGWPGLRRTGWWNEWRGAFRRREFRDQFFVTLAALLVTVLLMRAFVSYIGARMGAILHDHVLGLFPPVSFTCRTFTLVYAG